MSDVRLQSGDNGSAKLRPAQDQTGAQNSDFRAPRQNSVPVRPRLLNIHQAGEYLSLSPWTIREMIWRGELPEVRMGRRLLVDQRDLDALVDRNKRSRERI